MYVACIWFKIDSKLLSEFPEELMNYSVYICVCVLHSRIALRAFIQELYTLTELSTLSIVTHYPYFKYMLMFRVSTSEFPQPDFFCLRSHLTLPSSR
jgi:hypothetical protein